LLTKTEERFGMKDILAAFQKTQTALDYIGKKNIV